MSSTRKLLAILDLFSVERPLLTAEEIMATLSYSRPQAYRYIRDLCEAGLLGRFSSAYALGSRAIEFDYIARESDPMLKAAAPVMRQLQRENGCDTLLATMVGERIITVHHERGSDLTTVSYSRGRLLPLLRGAGSKAILATLPVPKQRALFFRHPEEHPTSALGGTWDEVRPALKRIRRAGFALSVGELDPANVAVAVAIEQDLTAPPSALVLVVGQARYATTDKSLFVSVAQAGAERIQKQLADAQIESDER